VIGERGLRIAASAGDDFRALLATGLTLVVVLQAAIIAAGNAKLIPLTGVTLPFISYGGSSLLANGIVLGLLLALGERGLGGPPGAPVLTRRERLGDAARALGDRVERAIA
ncbi:MAG: FtsW/RodA/SpoVE family cell cycle protein, partial [Candidatus Limnocylindrales bacterium]